MFVVDDLLGWLVGRLADAGYKRLATLVRGSDQARALKQAVTAAVQVTVGEIGPSDPEEADQIAEQINKAFRRRDPVPLPPGQPTLLETLQAGIAGQLAVLDDAGQPVVSLSGVLVSDVAGKFTGHLVHEIQIRGAQGGSLTPLAGQLNDDLTHLQGRRIEGRGERIEGMLAQLLDWLGDGLASRGSAGGPSVWPLAELGDPFALEVHRPVEPDVPQPGLPVLPVYVPREHDAALAEVVRGAAAGTSGIAVLVGGSSTGKTRACWQALELLRGVEPGWRLWHPIDPSRPGAALAELPGIGPRTVVWLNEAQFYLGPGDGIGEQVAAGLRDVLRNPGRGPVLVLATLWQQFWDELTTHPSGAVDRHAHARELLDGHDIPVPPAFTPAQLRQLDHAADPRLAQAAAWSRDGQVVQYLAGAPQLLARYHNAPPAARAVIDAAIDARRLGMRPALPRAFLETAAPGYLTETDWNLLDDDWLQQALRYTAKPSKGIRGPLTPIRPRPGPEAGSPGKRSAWQLADYLDQRGRHARRQLIPPASFWAAATSCADPADQSILSEAAYGRGLYREAARLYKQASAHGDPIAGARLIDLLHTLHPGDQRPADWVTAHASIDDPNMAWLLRALRTAGATGQVTTLASRAAAHASIDDPRAVDRLLDALREAGATGQVTTLLNRDPAAHASLDNPGAVAGLLDALRTAGATGQVTTLLNRDPAAHASLDNPRAVDRLLDALREAGATSQVTTLASRAAAHASLDDTYYVAQLLEALHNAGATGQVTTLASRAAAHASLDEPDMAWLLRALREAGAISQVTTLASRAAAHASLDDPRAVDRLLDALREAGATGQVTTLLDRDPAAHASLEDPGAVAGLLDALRKAGATGQVTTLASRAAAHASLDDPDMAWLLRALRKAGATSQVTTLLDRDPAAHASLEDPGAVAGLLDALREAGATGQVTTLLDRDPAAHVGLDDTYHVAQLLEALHNAGGTGQVTTLASRAAAHASLDRPGALATLLRALREAGATSQVTTLLDRDPAAHASLNDPAAQVSLDDPHFGARLLEEPSFITDVTDLLPPYPPDHASLNDGDAAPRLLRALREAGAQAQAAKLIDRLPAAGMFELFCKQEGRGKKFRFGRDTNGRPTKRWAWTDLG